MSDKNKKDASPIIDLTKSRYDMSTYRGRVKHYFETTNVLNVFVSKRKLEQAAQLVKANNKGKIPPGTTEAQLWRAKRLYDSAYHPDTGEKMFLLGRMSFQVPGNMIITGLMLTFYRNPYAVFFWQTANQTFNSIVTYVNRAASHNEGTSCEIMEAYAAATGSATITALSLNKWIEKKFGSGTLRARFVPFFAVAAANCINIPVMRQKELREGIPIVDEQGFEVGTSKRVSRKGITQVVISRICIAIPVTGNIYY